MPKLSTVLTMPRPNRWLQTRLIITRAVMGFSRSVSHAAELQAAAFVFADLRQGAIFGEQDLHEAALRLVAEHVRVASDVDLAVDGLLGFHYAHRQVLGHGHVAELAGELAGFGAVPRFLRDQQLLPKPLAFRAQLGSLFTRIIGHARPTSPSSECGSSPS